MNTAESHLLNEDGSNYDKDAYEKASNTVDICILKIHNKKLQLLTVKRKHPPYRGAWVIPGGFLDIASNETLEECASRELKEETHVTGVPIRQLGTYGDPNRDPRMRIITTVYYAFLSEEKLEEQYIEADDDAAEYKWMTISNKTIPKLGFDHNKIIKDLLKKIRCDIHSNPIAFEFLNNLFTWGELQDVYEGILGHVVLTPNFRRKINNQYRIIESNKSVPISKGRFPKLLEFGGVKSIY